MKKCLLPVLVFTGALLISVKSRPAVNSQPGLLDSLKTEQLIIVVTDNWNSIRAGLYCFEKIKGKWQLQFSFPAVVGKNGMALGEGIRPVQIPRAPVKAEGDMKSPAGLFNLGPAFGYAEKSQAQWIHIPYLRATDTLICIDDLNSRYYNGLINTGSVQSDWKSHEDMHRRDDEYKWGLFIQHNDHPVKKGKGSCIFLHIWEGAGEGTAGCTAMEEKNILKLLHWIRAQKHPILVQYPRSEYINLHAGYQLPDL
jgi:D-alanyl-D-alanine dipeptidase